MVIAFLILTLFHIIISRTIVLLQRALFHSFYDWVIVHHIYIYWSHLLYLFICPWTFKSFPCLLNIVNTADVNIGLYISFWIVVLSTNMPRNGIPYHTVTIFSFRRNLCTAFIVAVPVYIPTNNVEGFSFLCTFSSICYLLIF